MLITMYHETTMYIFIWVKFLDIGAVLCCPVAGQISIFQAEKNIFWKNSFSMKMISDQNYSFLVHQKYIFVV